MGHFRKFVQLIIQYFYLFIILKSLIILFTQQGLGKVFDIKKNPEDPEAEP